MNTSVTNVRQVEKHKPGTYVYIGRPSKWGNQFVIGMHGNRAEVIRRYEDWLLDTPEMLLAAFNELKGKALGCYCSPMACHGDVLARVANLKVWQGEAGDWCFEGEYHVSHSKGQVDALRAAYRYEKACIERSRR